MIVLVVSYTVSKSSSFYTLMAFIWGTAETELLKLNKNN